jgi:membrane protein required for colicin V production
VPAVPPGVPVVGRTLRGERVNIGDFLNSQNVFDLLVVLGLLGMFVLGYIQGTIRRLLGIASILFSLLLGAQLRAPFGTFLAQNWHQFPPEYSYMVAFGTIFLAGSIAFSLLIQGVYKRAPLFARANFVDEVLGGFLGIVQGVIILGAVFLILDSYFRLPLASIQYPAGELKFLRDFFEVYDKSGTGAIFRDSIIPAFLALAGIFIPEDIRNLYPHIAIGK